MRWMGWNGREGGTAAPWGLGNAHGGTGRSITAGELQGCEGRQRVSEVEASHCAGGPVAPTDGIHRWSAAHSLMDGSASCRWAGCGRLRRPVRLGRFHASVQAPAHWGAPEALEFSGPAAEVICQVPGRRAVGGWGEKRRQDDWNMQQGVLGCCARWATRASTATRRRYQLSKRAHGTRRLVFVPEKRTQDGRCLHCTASGAPQLKAVVNLILEPTWEPWQPSPGTSPCNPQGHPERCWTGPGPRAWGARPPR